MENWDFREWQAALAALGPRAAALVGLAAAERMAGCLGDERFRRHGAAAAGVARDLLQECWSGAQGEEDLRRPGYGTWPTGWPATPRTTRRSR